MCPRIRRLLARSHAQRTTAFPAVESVKSLVLATVSTMRFEDEFDRESVPQ